MPVSGIKASEIVETGHTRLATVAPATLSHKREALGIVHQARKVDQVRCSHDGGASLLEPVGH